MRSWFHITVAVIDFRLGRKAFYRKLFRMHHISSNRSFLCRFAHVLVFFFFQVENLSQLISNDFCTAPIKRGVFFRWDMFVFEFNFFPASLTHSLTHGAPKLDCDT